MAEWTRERTMAHLSRAAEIADELARESQACHLKMIALLGDRDNTEFGRLEKRIHEIHQDLIVLKKLSEAIAKAGAMWMIKHELGED